MIVKNENGRVKSVRTDEERLCILKAEIEGLSEKDRKLLIATLQSIAQNDDVILELLAEQRWIRRPVSMAQFLDDPYYLGESTKTLYPQIRKDLIEATESHNYRGLIVTGKLVF